jgi:hypothetical protein
MDKEIKQTKANRKLKCRQRERIPTPATDPAFPIFFYTTNIIKMRISVTLNQDHTSQTKESANVKDRIM